MSLLSDKVEKIIEDSPVSRENTQILLNIGFFSAIVQGAVLGISIFVLPVEVSFIFFFLNLFVAVQQHLLYRHNFKILYLTENLTFIGAGLYIFSFAPGLSGVFLSLLAVDVIEYLICRREGVSLFEYRRVAMYTE